MGRNIGSPDDNDHSHQQGQADKHNEISQDSVKKIVAHIERHALGRCFCGFRNLFGRFADDLFSQSKAHLSASLRLFDGVLHNFFAVCLPVLQVLFRLGRETDPAHQVLFALCQVAQGFLGLCEILSGTFAVFDPAVNGLPALAEDLGLQRFINRSRRDAVFALEVVLDLIGDILVAFTHQNIGNSLVADHLAQGRDQRRVSQILADRRNLQQSLIELVHGVHVFQVGDHVAQHASSISGIRVTKAFTNADKEKEKFEVGNGKFQVARKAAYSAMGRFHSGNTFVTDVFNVVVLIAGGLFLYNGQIRFGDYSAFIVSVNMFIGPVMTLINFMEQFENGITGFERFCEMMDEKPETDCPDAADAGILEGHIEFRDVSYAYDEDKNVLRHVDLDIEKGKTFALVGPSGGGKTTICHLIPHFYDVVSGQILLDGKEIHSLTLESVRRNIGIVQQDIYLFNDSMKENIRYGKLDATDDEIILAAKRANIHDYIMSLPNGYDTNIGERGVRLSGGQKQRLSIARVFLKNPPILILDEATSALDNTTEILIQQALDELCKGRTTLVVAHRLSTIKNADEIAVVSDGRIVEQGTHDELMAKQGMYYDLYQLQFRANAGIV